MTEIISRKQAAALGLPRYFTGKPCKRGHVAERQVGDRSCLVCNAEKVTRYRLAHPETAKATNDRCRAARNERDPNYVSDYNQRYYQANREQLLPAARQRSRDRYWQDPQAAIAGWYERRKRTLPQVNARIRRWQKEKLQTDLQFKLKANLRRRLGHAIRGKIKAGSAVKDLGCTAGELITWLEAKFTPGMTWDNYGAKGIWEVDHIKPLSAFDLTDRAQLLAACHYTNLQPMPKIANIKKSGVRKRKPIG